MFIAVYLVVTIYYR